MMVENQKQQSTLTKNKTSIHYLRGEDKALSPANLRKKIVYLIQLLQINAEHTISEVKVSKIVCLSLVSDTSTKSG